MPVNYMDVVELLAVLADEEEMKVTMKESLKGGLITGCTTVVGGMLGGPIGLAIGGTLGGVTAAYMSHGKFRPVGSVLREMNEQQKQELYQKVQTILSKLEYTDIFVLQAIITGDMFLKQQLLDQIIDQVQSRMGMTIID